jgi:hypothetical protein
MTPYSELTVLCPQNDGESKTIVGICRKLGVDLRVSDQSWGATLDREPAENLQNLKRVLAIVEMPSPQLEEKFRQKGHQVIPVDHHYYIAMGLDRRQPLSSLEQIAELLNYQLNRVEMGIAINDRSYIFGLLQAGYSVEEILEIRQFDLRAQGISAEQILKVKEALKNSEIRLGITILRTEFVNAGFAQDFLVLENPAEIRDLLILGGNPVRKVQFYGDPQKVEMLADLGEWIGGGDKSKFWGTNHPDIPAIFKRLGIDETQTPTQTEGFVKDED